MLVSQALQLMTLLLAQVTSAVLQGRQTIVVEELGDEHRQALLDLKAYLATLPPDLPPVEPAPEPEPTV